MSQLRVKTRGNSSPNGKSRVYFCCHPDDFAIHFEEISSDILANQNCAVYYKQDPADKTDEELEFDLKQMNLVVFPVTNSLLTGESEALRVDFPIAKDCNIPILPIVCEPGLDPLFAEKIGELQYLQKFEVDPTAIPYDDKLRDFLSAIILGGELAEKIRDAFDAYIFLSYRKKDRRYAQKLMELIHENEFCHDVAIWYDEYLTPGENFNELIAQALEKSELFVLAVTPNLVNEINYVMNIEYPMARDGSKPVLPVEMVDTDKDELKRSYEGIPDPISSQETETLKAILLQRLDQIKVSGKNDSRHRFFIGLAYLQGIDVEKNPIRALSMISEAAEAGLPEAIEKLVSMYSYGDGVTQDYKNALRWQERLTTRFAGIAEESRSDSDMMAYLLQRIKLAELAYEIELFDKAAQSFENAYEISKALLLGVQDEGFFKKIAGFAKRMVSRSEHAQKATFYMARSARMAMQAYCDLGLTDKAVEWGKRAVAASGGASMALSIAGMDLEGERASMELAATYGLLGEQILDSSGNIAGAREAFEREANAIPEGNDLESKLLETRVNKHFGLLEEADGNIKKAAEHYNNAINRMNSLYEEFKTDYKGWGLFPELFELYIQMCLLCQRANALGDANMVLDDFVRILDSDDVCASAKMVDHYRDLVNMYRGSILLDSNKPAEAKELLSDSVDRIQLFTNNKSISYESLDEAAYAYEKLGDCLAALGEIDQAIEWQEKACTNLSDNMALTNSVKATRKAAAGFEKLFDRYISRGDLSLAEEWYKKAEWCLNAVANSTKSAADSGRLCQLRKKKSLLNKEGYPAATDESISESLGAYVITYESEVEKKYPNFEKAIQTRMGKVMMDFFESHRAFSASYDILDLGRSLSGKTNAKLSREEVENEVSRLSGKIAAALMGAHNTFLEYDEQANLVTLYCGYMDLATAKHVIGGKAAALEDFLFFFENRPFWTYPLDKVDYKEAWLLVYYMIENKKFL